MNKLDFNKKVERIEDFYPVEPGYYAVIPATIRYAKITEGAKSLYGEITSLCNEHGRAVIDIRYFAFLYDVTPQKILDWSKELAKKDFISCDFAHSYTGELVLSI